MTETYSLVFLILYLFLKVSWVAILQTGRTLLLSLKHISPLRTYRITSPTLIPVCEPPVLKTCDSLEHLGP